MRFFPDGYSAILGKLRGRVRVAMEAGRERTMLEELPQRMRRDIGIHDRPRAPFPYNRWNL